MGHVQKENTQKKPTKRQKRNQQKTRALTMYFYGKKLFRYSLIDFYAPE